MPEMQQMLSSPTVINEELGEFEKQSFTTFATSYGEQGIKDANNQETGFGPRKLQYLQKE